MQIPWDDQAKLYGTHIKAFFFDGDAAKKETDLAKRVLPFFKTAKPKTLYTEADRKNFYHENLVAQPDVVFAHGNGIICTEYKSVGGKSHSRTDWQLAIRLKDMLQCMISGYAVAQNLKKPTACVLRYHNVCYLLSPEPGVIQAMLRLIPMAMVYHADDKRVAAAQLAQFSLDKIRSTYKGPADARMAAVKVAHDAMLRR